MNNISFWYAVSHISQLDFEGHEHFIDKVVGEGHIVYMDMLLCRQSRERLKAEAKAKKQKTVPNRIEGIKLCEKCQQKYKENENLDWQHWINSPPLKNNSTVQINPELSKLHGVKKS